MTVCFLIRHAAYALADSVLAGRTGPGLSSAGKLQALDLARSLARTGVTHVYSSPQKRALETAAPISRLTGISVRLAYSLDEVDFGTWTGRSFSDLDGDPAWRRWNEDRSASRAPGGESMAEAQRRIVHYLTGYAQRHPQGRAVMISHAEPIRAAVLACMSMPLDEWQAIDVQPASITTLAIGTRGQMILMRKAAA